MSVLLYHLLPNPLMRHFYLAQLRVAAEADGVVRFYWVPSRAGGEHWSNLSPPDLYISFLLISFSFHSVHA